MELEQNNIYATHQAEISITHIIEQAYRHHQKHLQIAKKSIDISK